MTQSGALHPHFSQFSWVGGFKHTLFPQFSTIVSMLSCLLSPSHMTTSLASVCVCFIVQFELTRQEQLALFTPAHVHHKYSFVLWFSDIVAQKVKCSRLIDPSVSCRHLTTVNQRKNTEDWRIQKKSPGMKLCFFNDKRYCCGFTIHLITLLIMLNLIWNTVKVLSLLCLQTIGIILLN